ncbi:hypothetical protein JTB14_002891 [Gonioctena quinquepunctata]|nr:hypothetical protein JTB14_002891 [Gonioctena quinquepunctata]
MHFRSAGSPRWIGTKYQRIDSNDTFLVKNPNMEDVGFDEPLRKFRFRRCTILVTILLGIFLFLCFMIVFVAIPLIFMNSIYLQQSLIFTHFGLPHDKTYFENYSFPALENKYVDVSWEGNTNLSLGVWHILPVHLAQRALHDPEYDFEASLLNSNYSVLIYFHGTGEARSYNTRKYQLLSYYFHIIAFDYRDYADSSPGTLSESAVVEDCIRLFNWVRNRTRSPIYIWGHSLGSALATSAVAHLEKTGIYVRGLVLESAFTSLRDELYVHQYGKLFAWLPWFKATILDPLYKNGFVFDTSSNIVNITCPIMILHAEDDPEVPCEFGRRLYEIASNRSSDGKNITVYHEFTADLDYDHNFIYQDPFLKFFIMDFVAMTANQSLSRCYCKQFQKIVTET